MYCFSLEKNFYNARNNFLNNKIMKARDIQKQDFIENNYQRPKKEGIYEVIRSDDSYDNNYFDGNHWQIDSGKRPVKKWRDRI